MLFLRIQHIPDRIDTLQCVGDTAQFRGSTWLRGGFQLPNRTFKCAQFTLELLEFRGQKAVVLLRNAQDG